MKLKKKVLATVLAGALSLGSLTPVFAESRLENPEVTSPKEVVFYDLEEGQWYTEAIKDLAERDIIRGENGFVKANKFISRAEYAQILFNALDLGGRVDLTSVPDVQTSDWFYEALSAVIAHGLIRGDGNLELRPNEFLTRQEVFVITLRAFEIGSLDELDRDYTKDYNDAQDVSDWARESLSLLIKKGYVNGDHLNNLLPKKYISKAELAALIRSIPQVKNMPTTVSIKNPDKFIEKPTETEKTLEKPAEKPADEEKDYKVPDWVNEPAKVWVEEEGHFEDVYKEKLVENALVVVHPAKYEIEIRTEYIFHERNNPGYGATFYSRKEASEYQRMLAELRDPKIYGNYQIREVKNVTDRLIEPEREEVIRPAKYKKVKVGQKWVVDKPGYWKEVK